MTLNKKGGGIKWILVGLLFTLLWSSASTATKVGLEVAQPLTIAVTRFAIASALMLIYAHGIRSYALPKGRQWRMVMIYALLNITIYLGLYVLAMKYVTAGIGALAIATSPIFISVLSVVFLKERLSLAVIAALLLGLIGVFVAAYPLLHNAGVSIKGLVLMLFGMLSYSAASIYFNKMDWGNLKLLTINGWQTLIGGLFLMPFVLLTYKGSLNRFDQHLWISAGWLAIFVSILAIQCWLWLLQSAPVKAGMWLYLCPISGFIIAAVMLREPLSLFTFIGVILVLAALLIVQASKNKTRIIQEELTLNE